MVKYEFNRSEFESGEQFYDVIQRKMELPDWFGKNPPALWDMLTGHIETPCEITLVGFNRKETDYDKYYIDLIIECFLDAQKDYPDDFKINIK